MALLQKEITIEVLKYTKIRDKRFLLFHQICGLFLIFYIFLQYYVLTFEMLVAKCRHGIQVIGLDTKIPVLSNLSY